jgi:drug/metabolite transporter (DMT)-like permease
MGVWLVLAATLSWSFVGILVKTAGVMVDTATITFARFAIGVSFLAILLWMMRSRFRLESAMKWVWIGAIGKGANYFFENIGISLGYSYGNILVGPLQTVFLLLLSVIWFKEKVSARGWLAASLCIAGVLLVTWNGIPLELLIHNGAWTTLLFALSAVGSALHVLSQKELIKKLDPGSMNVSVFFWSSVLMAIPLPFQSHTAGDFQWTALGAVIMLGIITGGSFYIFAKALKITNFTVVVIVINTGAMFSILWSWLFFREPITMYIIGGAAVFLSGLIILNLPAGKQTGNPDQAQREDSRNGSIRKGTDTHDAGSSSRQSYGGTNRTLDG